MRMRAIATAAAAAALLSPAGALADGDPASDVLPQRDVYFPYIPPVSKPYGPALEALLKRARAIGYPIKVALIQSTGDLGAYPNLFGKPQQYSDLLASELRVVQGREPLRLLVVMPTGFGGQNLGENVDRALAPIEIDTAAGSDGLARAALEAVARLATADGHPLSIPPEAFAKPAGSSRGGTSPLIYIVPLVLVALGVAVAGWLARRAPGPPVDSDGDGGPAD